MADNRGGYRKPSRPAPVSGPGRLSRRTDGGPAQKVRQVTGGPVGDRADFEAMQKSAPMAANDVPASSAPSPAGPPPGPAVDVPAFNAPTMRPDEPITAGNPMGDGVGPEAMGLTDPRDQIDQEDARRMAAYLPALEHLANQPGSSASLRSYVRQIKALNV